MNKLHQLACKKSILLFCLACIGVYGQKQTKTYKESFKVGNDAIIDINTSYADIEFETWDKNEVVVEAVVSLEGASEDEAKSYFEKGGVKILGNSKQIEISTGAETSWSFVRGIAPVDVSDFAIEIPGFPELEPLFLDLEIPEIPPISPMAPMPPMPAIPPVKMQNFDYEAYEKDGEKYMKKWKAEFDKNFDADYKKRMAEWSEKVKERSEEWKEQMEEQKEMQKELQKERQEQMKERQEQMKEQEERRNEAQKQRVLALKDRVRVIEEQKQLLDSTRNFLIQGDSLFNGPNIFFGSSTEGNRKFKIKKTIKIKMPKSAKLKMNVRHGEVKLAENTRDINATLSYARLLASTIEGDQTNIRASYSPVTVKNWDNGMLNLHFSDKVALRDVKFLNLSATSSDVTIDRLLQSAMIRNNLGALRINDISQNFKDMDISMQNGELTCVLPATPYTIYVNGTSSTLSSPAYLVMDVTKNKNTTIHKGYNLNKDADRSIVINTAYSDVVLQK